MADILMLDVPEHAPICKSNTTSEQTSESGFSSPSTAFSPSSTRCSSQSSILESEDGCEYQSLSSSDAMDDTKAPSAAARKSLSFLDLPYEIRQQIYSYIHLTHPMQRRKVAAWYPLTIQGMFVSRLVPSEPATAATATNTTTTIPSPSSSEASSFPSSSQQGVPPTAAATVREETLRTTQGLLDPYRPHGFIPTSLLLSTRQIYNETALLPWKNNEFSFINWVTSGLSGASAFLSPLPAWQKNAIRYARIECNIMDLIDVSSSEDSSNKNGDASFMRGGFLGISVWEGTSEMWDTVTEQLGDVRGLRIMVSAEEKERMLNDTICSSTAGSSSNNYATPKWIAALAKMPRLQQLEIELQGEWHPEEKIFWCDCVQRMLNVARGAKEGDQVKVFATERVRTRKRGLGKKNGNR